MADIPAFAFVIALHDTVALFEVTLDAVTEVGACADEPWFPTTLMYPSSAFPDVNVLCASHTGCVDVPYSVNEVANAAVVPK